MFLQRAPCPMSHGPWTVLGAHDTGGGADAILVLPRSTAIYNLVSTEISAACVVSLVIHDNCKMELSSI